MRSSSAAASAGRDLRLRTARLHIQTHTRVASSKDKEGEHEARDWLIGRGGDGTAG